MMVPESPTLYLCWYINVACLLVCRLCVGVPPSGPLKAAIEAQWGSLQKLQETMSAATVGVQGSGWGWLGYVKT